MLGNAGQATRRQAGDGHQRWPPGPTWQPSGPAGRGSVLCQDQPRRSSVQGQQDQGL